MWPVKFSNEARTAFLGLEKAIQAQVSAGIKKVSANPLPYPKGYGKPLGSKGGRNLTGLLKIKFLDSGIRVVYSLASEKRIMNILAIARRSDDYCYRMAARIVEKYGDEIYKDTFDDMS